MEYQSSVSKERQTTLLVERVIACPVCAAQIILDRSPIPHIDECGFESYRFECRQCNVSLACIIDPRDESLLVSQPNI